MANPQKQLFRLCLEVISLADGAVGNNAISLYVGNTSLELTFYNFEMIDLGNDMTKTVIMSGWTFGIYLVRVDCNGQRYSKKFLK